MDSAKKHEHIRKCETTASNERFPQVEGLLCADVKIGQQVVGEEGKQGCVWVNKRISHDGCGWGERFVGPVAFLLCCVAFEIYF